MQFSQVISVVTVRDEHLPQARKMAHQAMDSLVIEGLPVFGARVRVKKICDPKTLALLMEKLKEQ